MSPKLIEKIEQKTPFLKEITFATSLIHTEYKTVYKDLCNFIEEGDFLIINMKNVSEVNPAGENFIIALSEFAKRFNRVVAFVNIKEELKNKFIEKGLIDHLFYIEDDKKAIELITQFYYDQKMLEQTPFGAKYKNANKQQKSSFYTTKDPFQKYMDNLKTEENSWNKIIEEKLFAEDNVSESYKTKGNKRVKEDGLTIEEKELLTEEIKTLSSPTFSKSSKISKLIIGIGIILVSGGLVISFSKKYTYSKHPSVEKVIEESIKTLPKKNSSHEDITRNLEEDIEKLLAEAVQDTSSNKKQTSSSPKATKKTSSDIKMKVLSAQESKEKIYKDIEFYNEIETIVSQISNLKIEEAALSQIYSLELEKSSTFGNMKQEQGEKKEKLLPEMPDVNIFGEE